MKELIQAKIDKYEADKAEMLELVEKYSIPNTKEFFDAVIADLEELKAKA